MAGLEKSVGTVASPRGRSQHSQWVHLIVLEPGPAEVSSHLGTQGHRVQPAADPVARLQHKYLAARRGQRAGGGQPGDPGTDHHHPLAGPGQRIYRVSGGNPRFVGAMSHGRHARVDRLTGQQQPVTDRLG
jgi:hypothetical protein